jgi:hypothetical protein
VAKDVGKLSVNDPQESTTKEATPTTTAISPMTISSSPLHQEIAIVNKNKDGDTKSPVGDTALWNIALEKLPQLQNEIANNMNGKGAVTTTMPLPLRACP